MKRKKITYPKPQKLCAFLAILGTLLCLITLGQSCDITWVSSDDINNPSNSTPSKSQGLTCTEPMTYQYFYIFCESYISIGANTVGVFEINGQSYDSDSLTQICFSHVSEDTCTSKGKIFNKYSLYKWCLKIINKDTYNNFEDISTILCFN